MLKSVFLSIFVTFCLSIFEAAVLSNAFFLPAVPDLVLLCVIFLSINNGRFFGSILGFCSGLFLDFLTASPLGFHCLLYSLLGYFLGFFCKIINIHGIFVSFVITLFVSILKGGAILLISILYPNVNLAQSIFSAKFAFEILFNTILTPFMFRFLSLFEKILILSPEEIF